MLTRYIVGFGAGLASGVLFASVLGGSALAITLIFLAPLPIYIAGLGWGPIAAVLGGAGGLAVVIPVLGPKSAIGFLSTLAVPAIFLCYLLSLRRQPPASTPRTERNTEPAASVEWYPLGRVIAWAALIAGIISALSVLFLGTDFESYRTAINAILDRTILNDISSGAAMPFSKSVLAKYRETVIWMLPAASALVWLLGAVTNIWLAGRITKASGLLARPWPDLALIDYPRNFIFGFAASVLAAFMPGFPGLIATGFAAAFFFAYVLLGLAIIHTITRNLAMRAMLLFTLYFGLLAFGWISFLIAIIGLGEPLFKLRERMTNRGNPPAQTGG